MRTIFKKRYIFNAFLITILLLFTAINLFYAVESSNARLISLHMILVPLIMAALFIHYFIYKNIKKKIELELQKKKCIINIIPDRFLVFNGNGECIDVGTPSHHGIFNYNIVNNISDIFPEKLHEKAFDIFQKTIKTGKDDKIDFDIIADGKKKFFDAIFIASEHDTVTIFLRDITERKLLEKQLRNRTDYLQNIFNSITNPFYVIDIETRKIVMSNTFSDNNEHPVSCSEFLHGTSLSCADDAVCCPIDIIIKTEKPAIIEHEHINTDGSLSFYEIHAHPVFNENGELKQIIEYNYDITAKKNIEKSLFESEHNYRNFFNNIPIGLINTDSNGKILAVNPLIISMLQIDPFVYISGFNIKDIPEFGNSGISEKIFETINRKEKIFSYNESKLKNGKNIYLKSIFTPIIDSKNILTGVQAIIEDITESKISEKEIIQLSQAVQQSANSIVITDLDGNITFVNDYCISHTGYSKEELLGKNPRILKTDYLPKEAYTDLWNTITSGGIWRGEFHNRKKDGTEFWEKSTISPIKDHDGKIISYIAIKEDISEKKTIDDELIRARDAADRANKSKTIFLANMSHEIRTPMNGIIGMNNLLLETELTPEQKEYALTIKTSAGMLMSILNDILDISKIEAGKIIIEKIEFNFREIIKTAFKVFSTMVASKRLEYLLNIDERIPVYLSGDPTRLSQIIMNLINNAIKFTSKGKISVDATALEESDDDISIIITVSDTGIGIPDSKIEMLFKTFTQLDSSTSRKYGGSGLGLSISKRLVELMNGRINVRSEEGRGSIFEFVLPFKKAKQKEYEYKKEMSGIKSPITYSSGELLLVEDNPVNQLLTKIILIKSGYNVDIAENGVDAMNYFNEKKYGVILMDIQMPDIDGYELTRTFRKMEKDYFHTPIIAMTANTMPGDREKCIEAGMDDYIAKPVERKELIEKVEKWISRKVIFPAS